MYAVLLYLWAASSLQYSGTKKQNKQTNSVILCSLYIQ